MTRKWTDIQSAEQAIIQMRKDGRTRQEIADELGFEKVQIKNWINRYNRRQAKLPTLPKRSRAIPVFSSSCWKDVRAEIKYRAIAQNAGKYPVKYMCRFFGVSRSGYYAFAKRQDRPSKDDYLAGLIEKCQQEAYGTYGYIRVRIWFERRGIQINHKAVLRIMNKYGLLAQIRRRRKYQQMSSQLHRYPNVFNRDFTATRPNQKWVTDISYIQTPQGTLYLSMIRDLFDNSIVAYNMGTEQTINLVFNIHPKHILP